MSDIAKCRRGKASILMDGRGLSNQAEYFFLGCFALAPKSFEQYFVLRKYFLEGVKHVGNLDWRL